MTYDRPLAEVFRSIGGGAFPPVVESFERSKTIFFPGDPAERVYVLIKGAVKLSRVYEAGEEITVALLRENSVFGVLSLITGHRSDRFYHAVAFTSVELLSVPIEQVEKALKSDPELPMVMFEADVRSPPLAMRRDPSSIAITPPNVLAPPMVIVPNPRLMIPPVLLITPPKTVVSPAEAST